MSTRRPKTRATITDPRVVFQLSNKPGFALSMMHMTRKNSRGPVKRWVVC
jgi:hypothetical protein